MLLEGLVGENCGDVIFPSGNRFARSRVGSIEKSLLGDRERDVRHVLLYRVPEDDVTIRNVFVAVYPDDDDVLITRGDLSQPPGVYDTIDDGWWGIESSDQDRVATEGQGPITDRSLEHLAPSDSGVILFRNQLRQAIRDVAEGRDPIGVIREPERNPIVHFDTRQHDIVPQLGEFARIEVS